jgi:hypothetical protein
MTIITQNDFLGQDDDVLSVRKRTACDLKDGFFFICCTVTVVWERSTSLILVTIVITL